MGLTEKKIDEIVDKSLIVSEVRDAFGDDSVNVLVEDLKNKLKREL